MPQKNWRIVAYMLRYLIQAAQQKRVVPYHELENIFGLSHNMAGYYTGQVGEFCQDQGWPLLNALVINTTHCKPSAGFEPFLNSDGNEWGECLANCWREFHLPTTRELQVRNFSGLNKMVQEWSGPDEGD